MKAIHHHFQQPGYTLRTSEWMAYHVRLVENWTGARVLQTQRGQNAVRNYRA